MPNDPVKNDDSSEAQGAPAGDFSRPLGARIGSQYESPWSERIVVTFNGKPHTRGQVLQGLNCHFRAIKMLWPRWGSYSEEEAKPSVTDEIRAFIETAPFPVAASVHGYSMLPPDQYTSKGKWQWLLLLLHYAGEIDGSEWVADEIANITMSGHQPPEGKR